MTSCLLLIHSCIYFLVFFYPFFLNLLDFDTEFTYVRIKTVPLIPSEQGLIKNYFIHMEQGSLGARIISESPCAPTTLVFLFWLHSSLVPGNMASRAKVLHWATCECWARLFESLCKQILVGEACRSVEIQAHTLVSHSS